MLYRIKYWTTTTAHLRKSILQSSEDNINTPPIFFQDINVSCITFFFCFVINLTRISRDISMLTYLSFKTEAQGYSYFLRGFLLHKQEQTIPSIKIPRRLIFLHYASNTFRSQTCNERRCRGLPTHSRKGAIILTHLVIYASILVLQ